MTNSNLPFIESVYATQNFAKDIRKKFSDRNNKVLTGNLEKIINIYRSAKQSRMLGKKHDKSKEIIANLILILDQCHEESIGLLEHFLAQVLFESDITSDENKSVNNSSPYILLSDALLYKQREEPFEAFLKLNLFFENHLFTENLRPHWDFYMKYILISEDVQLEGLKRQLSNLGMLPPQLQEMIRSSIHKLLEKIQLHEEFDLTGNSQLDVNLLMKNIEMKLRHDNQNMSIDHNDYSDLEATFAHIQEQDEEQAEVFLSEIFHQYIQIEEFLTKKYGKQLDNLKTQYYLMQIDPESKEWNDLLIDHIRAFLQNDAYEKAVAFIKELIETGKNDGDCLITIIKELDHEFDKTNPKFNQFISFVRAFKDVEFELQHRVQYFYKTIGIMKNKSNQLFNLPDYIQFCDEITAAFVKLVEGSNKGKIKREWRKSAYVDRGLFKMYNFKDKKNCLEAITYFNIAFKDGFNEIKYYKNVVFCYVKAGELNKCKKFVKGCKDKISEDMISTQMIKRIQTIQNVEEGLESFDSFTPRKIKCIEKVKEFVQATETVINPTEDLLSLRALNTILQDDYEDLNKAIYEYLQPQMKIKTLSSNIYLNRIFDCLKFNIEKDKNLLGRVFLLVYLAPNAGKVFVDYLEENQSVKYTFTNLADKYFSIHLNMDSQMIYEINEQLDYLNIEFDAFIRSEFTKSDISEKTPVIDDLFIQKLDPNSIKEYRRLKERVNILKDIADYTERMDKLRKYQDQLEDRKKEIILQPTIMQTYLYNEYENNLMPLMQKIEKESNKNLAPKIDLSVSAVAYDFENVNSTTVSVTLVNGKNRAYAADVKISILSAKGLVKAEFSDIGTLTTDSLGYSKEMKLDHYKESSVIVKVDYKFNGKSQPSIKKKYDIRVIGEKFKEVHNPYIVGRPVYESNMFYGRTDLVNKLYRKLIDQHVSVVMYGQKRVGKTSTYHHLKQKLMENNYCVISFSFSNKMDEFRFYKDLVQKIVISVGEELPIEFEDMAYEIPAGDILFASSLLEKIIMHLKNNELKSYKGIILEIDEFTNLYTLLKSNEVEASLLGTFKYLIESNLFRVAVIGQDTFLDFYSAYSNELSILERIEIGYLGKLATLDLIEKPILLENGTSRYEDGSAAEVYDLTKGQPLFTQKFCSHIVEYLNRQKQHFITRGTINLVKIELINKMVESDFDNLLVGGVGSQLDPENVRRILEIIAKNSRYKEYCGVGEFKEIPDAKAILIALKDRNVLEARNGDYYKIYVPLFNDWLLQNCKY